MEKVHQRRLVRNQDGYLEQTTFIAMILIKMAPSIGLELGALLDHLRILTFRVKFA
jgi:hypothetical protein